MNAVSGRLSKTAGLIVAAALAVSPLAARAENLADALVGAYKTSGLLPQNRALLRAADEDVAIAVSALRPILDWTGRVSRSISERTQNDILVSSPQSTDVFFGLTAQLLLYDGGATKLGVRAAQETVMATRQSLLSIEQSVLLRAVTAYMNVIRQSETVRLRENNVRVLGQELRAAQDRFDVGEVTRTDVALAESRRAAARSDLAAARGALADAQQEYLAAVGNRPGRLVASPALPKAPPSIAAAKTTAVRNHPDVLAAQYQVSAAEINVQRSEATLGPTARLRGDVGWTNSLSNADTYSDQASIGIELNQRLYQGGGRAAQVRQTMANRDATRSNLLNVQENIAQQAANAFVALQVANSTLSATQLQIRAAQVAFDGIREEATLGARTTLDVLDAEQELLNARAAQISARVDRYIAAYSLLAAQGALTAERLGLPVQIYDPAAYYNQVRNAPARYSKQGKELDRVLRALGKK